MNREKLLSLICSCDFLPQELLNKWVVILPRMPESFYGLVHQTFSEAKKQIDSLYARFELSRDKGGNYQNLIKRKSEDAAAVVKKMRFENITGDILS